MLTAATQTKLKALGFDPDALVAAIKAETETDLTIPNLLTPEQVSTLSTNIRKDGFEEGKTAMREILVKDIKTKAGLQIETKELDPVLEALKEAWKKPAGNPELENSLKELQKKYTEDLSAKDSALAQARKELNGIKVRSTMAKYLPEETIIDKDYILTLFASEHEVEQTDSGAVVKKSGNVLKDDLQNPKSLEAVVKEFAMPFAKKEGRAGGDEPGGAGGKSFTNPDEHFAYWTKKGENPMDHLDTLKMIPDKK